MASASATVQESRWPRLVVIFYLLAGLAIAATAGGVVGTRWMGGAPDQALVVEQEAARARTNAWRLMALTSDMQAVAMQGAAARSAEAEKKALAGKATEFRFVLADLAHSLRKELTGEGAVQAERLLNAVGAGEKQFSEATVEALEGLARGKNANDELASLSTRIAMVQARINDLTRLMAVNQTAKDVERASASRTMRRMEVVTSLLAVLVVVLLASYWRWMSRHLRRKYDELQKTHHNLEEAHEQALAFAREIDATNHSVVALNRQLAENVAALRAAQAEILRKGRMASLGQIIATVAHELRNPLGAVRTSAYLLERRLREGDAKGKGIDVDAQLLRINAGITRCDDTITQLLDFSRSRELTCEDVDLDHWLAKLVEEEAERLPEQVTITCLLGLGAQKVPMDPSRLQRAVYNLINNASEAMVGKPGNPLKNPTADPRITVTTELRTDMAAIIISDNGPGMTPEVVAKVREPMFTTKNFGTGLGIPAVEQIMAQHGGHLDIASTPGEGSRFSMLLPLKQAERGEAALVA